MQKEKKLFEQHENMKRKEKNQSADASLNKKFCKTDEDTAGNSTGDKRERKSVQRNSVLLAVPAESIWKAQNTLGWHQFMLVL
jgi:hypothetical protein